MTWNSSLDRRNDQWRAGGFFDRAARNQHKTTEMPILDIAKLVCDFSDNGEDGGIYMSIEDIENGCIHLHKMLFDATSDNSMVHHKSGPMRDILRHFASRLNDLKRTDPTATDIQLNKDAFASAWSSQFRCDTADIIRHISTRIAQVDQGDMPQESLIGEESGENLRNSQLPIINVLQTASQMADQVFGVSNPGRPDLADTNTPTS